MTTHFEYKKYENLQNTKKGSNVKRIFRCYSNAYIITFDIIELYSISILYIDIIDIDFLHFAVFSTQCPGSNFCRRRAFVSISIAERE